MRAANAPTRTAPWVGVAASACSMSQSKIAIAAAANGLIRPSSAARALFAGAPNIERVDRLVQSIAAQHGMRNAELDATVALVDARLELNRKAAA